jgi:transcriptional regulator with XRE-family HTH domain
VEIERARQRRWTGAVIAEAVGLSRATMARTLRGLGRTLGPAHRAALAQAFPWRDPWRDLAQALPAT